MKNTMLWFALFNLICLPIHADTNTQTITPPTDSTTQTTPSVQPVQQVNPSELPAVKTPTAVPGTINCDYKIPAETKIIDQKTIMTWSEKATVQAFDFEPASMDSQLQNLKNCFTDQGWTSFDAALQKSGNVEAIKTQNLTVSSQVDGDVKVSEEKDNQWKVILPLQVVYQNDKEKVTQLLNINLTVGRKITGDLGIMQMIAAPRTVVTQQPTTSTTTTNTGADANGTNTTTDINKASVPTNTDAATTNPVPNANNPAPTSKTMVPTENTTVTPTETKTATPSTSTTTPSDNGAAAKPTTTDTTKPN